MSVETLRPQHGEKRMAERPELPNLVLSICVPTYHRPELLGRALSSIGALPADVEIIVSDNSTDNDLCEQKTKQVLDKQPASQWRYFRNEPGGNIGTNWTHCLERARGHYILMLHDDDYLLPNGLETIVRALRKTRELYHAVLFNVQVVDGEEQLIKEQASKREEYLAPKQAVEQVLSNSSLVRMPAIAVSREAYLSVGGIDVEQKDTDDTDIWMRVFARYGLYRVPEFTAAYTVHAGALTMGMFNETNINLVLRIFRKAECHQLLTDSEMRMAQARFFHQFILAGAYRALRRRDIKDAHRILQLFHLPVLQKLPIPARWLSVRLALSGLVRLTLPFSSPLLPKLRSSF
ncbi:glycosyltransferase family 2 protein [Hymenobacter seoulensis]